jgi:16S rRNA (adenine1518-N6/adenine1519-N6)-dimethyltransferase
MVLPSELRILDSGLPLLAFRGEETMRRLPPAYAQHFLHDRNILSAIVSAADLRQERTVLEIGVGTGRLTEMILAEDVTVTGVEVDEKLLSDLKKKLGKCTGLKLVKGDIMRIAWDEILPQEGKAVLMGNLPYAVSTQVIFKAIDYRDRIERAVFLVQWEVGARMTARAGTKNYGILSVACQMFGRPEIVRKIPPSVFLPAPKVDSALIRWDLFENAVCSLRDKQFTMQVVKAAFGQRRKKLVNSLSSGMPLLGKERLGRILEGMDLANTVRAEELTVQEFAELANRLYDAGTR